MAKKAIEIEGEDFAEIEAEDFVPKPEVVNTLAEILAICERRGCRAGVTSRADGSKTVTIGIPANG